MALPPLLMTFPTVAARPAGAAAPAEEESPAATPTTISAPAHFVGTPSVDHALDRVDSITGGAALGRARSAAPEFKLMYVTSPTVEAVPAIIAPAAALSDCAAVQLPSAASDFPSKAAAAHRTVTSPMVKPLVTDEFGSCSLSTADELLRCALPAHSPISGRGASGSVFAVDHDGATVAVKLIRATTEDKAKAASREVRLIKRLMKRRSGGAAFGCRHVVRVHKVFVDAEQRETRIVMEHLPGGSVAELPELQRLRLSVMNQDDASLPLFDPPSGDSSDDEGCDAALPVPAVGSVVSDACASALCESELLRVAKGALAGLAYLHDALGVLHRDIKPENLLVDAAGAVKIVDFGVSSSGLEGAQQVGTTAYMAPERLRGERHGPASDVWSLGVTLLQLALGGRHPFLTKPVVDACPDRFWSMAAALQATGSASECAAAVDAAVRSALATASLSQEFSDCVSRMLSADASERPTARGALDECTWLRSSV